jgi:hypothetical protein
MAAMEWTRRGNCTINRHIVHLPILTANCTAKRYTMTFNA